MAARRRMIRRKVTRKKARRKYRARKKQEVIDNPDTQETASLVLLVNRLQDIFSNADVQAGAIRDQAQIGLQKLEDELNTAVDKFTDGVCSALEDLTGEVEERLFALEQRELEGDETS